MPVSFRRRAAALVFSLLLAAPLAPVLHADAPSGQSGESLSEITLRGIVERQKSLLAQAAEAQRKGDKLDEESFRTQLESLVHEYELLIQQSPDFAAAYASYGYLLSKLEMPKEAMAMLVKADHLDPTIPLVKNELGNFLAEDGKPLEAADYYRSAMKLDPDEPLYPYQLGTLLYEGRDVFLQQGGYTRAQLDQEMLAAFRRAASLAPDRIAFTYRYAEAFADVDPPDWAGAFQAWADLLARTSDPQDRQVLLLQEAHVRLEQHRPDDARPILAQVTDPQLESQKQKLIAQLPENAKK